MIEQMLRMACVFRRDKIDFFENPHSPQSDVLEIAYGRGNDVQRAGHEQTTDFNAVKSDIESVTANDTYQTNTATDCLAIFAPRTYRE